MKLAIIKLSAMGDIIHAMVALQYIKQFDDSIQIDWVVEEAFAPVLEHNPHIDNIYTINLKSIKKNKKALFSQIRHIKTLSQKNYDLIIDAQGLIKSAIVAKLLGKNRAGFSKKSTREGLASFFYQTKVNIAYGENAIERNTKVLSQPLGFDISKEDILNKEAFLYFEDVDTSSLLVQEKKNIVFVIGASWKSKMYDKDKFVNVINALEKHHCIIVWGSEQEKEVAEYIASKSCAIAASKLCLNELKALISKADLIIGNDTGPTHMAWALNRPSITLFGNTPGYRNTYITEQNRVLESLSFVDPCKLKKDDFSISEIDEKEIVSLALELLEKA